MRARDTQKRNTDKFGCCHLWMDCGDVRRCIQSTNIALTREEMMDNCYTAQRYLKEEAYNIYFLIFYFGGKILRLRVAGDGSKTEGIVDVLRRRLEIQGIAVFVVNTTHPVPPSFTPERPPGRLWCPYCGKWRIFEKDASNYTRCKVCGISTLDYHTKRYNEEKAPKLSLKDRLLKRVRAGA